MSAQEENEVLKSRVRQLEAACESMLAITGGSENWQGETHESLKLIEEALKGVAA